MAGKIQIRLAILAALAALAALLVPSGLALGSHDEATNADFIDDQGVLRLQLNDTDGDRFRWFNGSSNRTQMIEQTRCEASLSGDNLVQWTSSPNKRGLVTHSLGVKTGGAQGVACSRISNPESLTLDITGGLLAGLEIAEVQLDVELKMSGWVKLQTYNGNTPLELFELRSGSSITSVGNNSVEQVVESTSVQKIANCLQPSDSGPDAGALDNCRWVIKDILPFNRMTFTAMAGEFSIEAGDDGTPTDPNSGLTWGRDSLFFLTDVETLNCGGSADFGDDTLGGDVTLACPPGGFKVVRYSSSPLDNRVIVTTVGDNTTGFSYTVENWHFDAQPASADPHLEYNDGDPTDESQWSDAPFCLDDPRDYAGYPTGLTETQVTGLFPGTDTTCIVVETRTTVGGDLVAEIIGDYLVVSIGDFGRGFK